MIQLQKMCITTFVILLSYLPLAAQQDSITKPKVNWSRSHNTDIKHIALNLSFDWKKKQASGSATITFSLFKSTDKITLDAAMLDIHKITLNGNALKYSYDGSDKDDALQITLDKMYEANKDISIQIDYSTKWVNQSDVNNLWGSFGKGIRFFEPSSTDKLRRTQIWSHGEAQGNRYWFPCYDAPNDLRTTSFTARVDKKLNVISNGSLTKTTDNADATRTFYFSDTIPYANHLTGFVIGEYVDIQQKYKDVELRTYAYPDEVEATKASTIRLLDMLKFFSEKTGMMYPYKSYSQIFVQDHPGFMSHHTFSTITENTVDDDRTHADYFYLWDLTESETLAQQWFGNSISANNWSDVWLNKSLAHYMNELYNEYKNGRDEFFLYQLLYDQNTIYLNDWNSGYRHPVVTKNYDDVDAFVNDNYATTRGALVLHMLSKHVGDDMWWKIIQQYTKENAGKSVSTEDFRKAIEAVSGEPMDWFFEQWIYKMGHPIFEITKQYDASKQQLSLRVKQVQTIDSSNTYPQTLYFKGKVAIAIDNNMYEVLLEDKEQNVFTFNAAQAPKLINFDVENTWIKEIKFEKSTAEYVYQLLNDKDITARNFALTNLSIIASTDSVSSKDKSEIHEAFRKIIADSSVYWRLRFNALFQYRNLFTGKTIDAVTIQLLLSVIKNETSWLRTSAITFLGNTKDKKYVPIYLNALNDESDRVINAAAIALGKTKSLKAFNVLSKLVDKPSWKNQSLISALNGFRELGDVRAYAIAYNALKNVSSPHWTLATPVWDYRITAAQTIASLGKSKEAYPYLLSAFKKSVEENDLHGIFYNVLLIITLADKRGIEIFDVLKTKYKDNSVVLSAVEQYETTFKESVKNK